MLSVRSEVQKALSRGAKSLPKSPSASTRVSSGLKYGSRSSNAKYLPQKRAYVTRERRIIEEGFDAPKMPLSAAPLKRAYSAANDQQQMTEDIKTVVSSMVPFHTLKAIGEKQLSGAALKIWNRKVGDYQHRALKLSLEVAKDFKAQELPDLDDVVDFPDWLTAVESVFRSAAYFQFEEQNYDLPASASFSHWNKLFQDAQERQVQRNNTLHATVEALETISPENLAARALASDAAARGQDLKDTPLQELFYSNSPAFTEQERNLMLNGVLSIVHDPQELSRLLGYMNAIKAGTDVEYLRQDEMQRSEVIQKALTERLKSVRHYNRLLHLVETALVRDYLVRKQCAEKAIKNQEAEAMLLRLVDSKPTFSAESLKDLSPRYISEHLPELLQKHGDLLSAEEIRFLQSKSATPVQRYNETSLSKDQVQSLMRVLGATQAQIDQGATIADIPLSQLKDTLLKAQLNLVNFAPAKNVDSASAQTGTALSAEQFEIISGLAKLEDDHGLQHGTLLPADARSLLELIPNDDETPLDALDTALLSPLSADTMAELLGAAKDMLNGRIPKRIADALPDNLVAALSAKDVPADVTATTLDTAPAEAAAQSTEEALVSTQPADAAEQADGAKKSVDEDEEDDLDAEAVSELKTEARLAAEGESELEVPLSASAAPLPRVDQNTLNLSDTPLYKMIMAERKAAYDALLASHREDQALLSRLATYLDDAYDAYPQWFPRRRRSLEDLVKLYEDEALLADVHEALGGSDANLVTSDWRKTTTESLIALSGIFGVTSNEQQKAFEEILSETEIPAVIPGASDSVALSTPAPWKAWSEHFPSAPVGALAKVQLKRVLGKQLQNSVDLLDDASEAREKAQHALWTDFSKDQTGLSRVSGLGTSSKYHPTQQVSLSEILVNPALQRLVSTIEAKLAPSRDAAKDLSHANWYSGNLDKNPLPLRDERVGAGSRSATRSGSPASQAQDEEFLTDEFIKEHQADIDAAMAFEDIARSYKDENEASITSRAAQNGAHADVDAKAVSQAPRMRAMTPQQRRRLEKTSAHLSALSRKQVDLSEEERDDALLLDAWASKEEVQLFNQLLGAVSASLETSQQLSGLTSGTGHVAAAKQNSTSAVSVSFKEEVEVAAKIEARKQLKNLYKSLRDTSAEMAMTEAQMAEAEQNQLTALKQRLQAANITPQQRNLIDKLIHKEDLTAQEQEEAHAVISSHSAPTSTSPAQQAAERAVQALLGDLYETPKSLVKAGLLAERNEADEKAFASQQSSLATASDSTLFVAATHDAQSEPLSFTEPLPSADAVVPLLRRKFISFVLRGGTAWTRSVMTRDIAFGVAALKTMEDAIDPYQNNLSAIDQLSISSEDQQLGLMLSSLPAHILSAARDQALNAIRHRLLGINPPDAVTVEEQLENALFSEISTLEDKTAQLTRLVELFEQKGIKTSVGSVKDLQDAQNYNSKAAQNAKSSFEQLLAEKRAALLQEHLNANDTESVPAASVVASAVELVLAGKTSMNDAFTSLGFQPSSSQWKAIDSSLDTLVDSLSANPAQDVSALKDVEDSVLQQLARRASSVAPTAAAAESITAQASSTTSALSTLHPAIVENFSPEMFFLLSAAEKEVLLEEAKTKPTPSQASNWAQHKPEGATLSAFDEDHKLENMSAHAILDVDFNDETAVLQYMASLPEPIYGENGTLRKYLESEAAEEEGNPVLATVSRYLNLPTTSSIIESLDKHKASVDNIKNFSTKAWIESEANGDRQYKKHLIETTRDLFAGGSTAKKALAALRVSEEDAINSGKQLLALISKADTPSEARTLAMQMLHLISHPLFWKGDAQVAARVKSALPLPKMYESPDVLELANALNDKSNPSIQIIHYLVNHDTITEAEKTPVMRLLEERIIRGADEGDRYLRWLGRLLERGDFAAVFVELKRLGFWEPGTVYSEMLEEVASQIEQMKQAVQEFVDEAAAVSTAANGETVPIYPPVGQPIAIDGASSLTDGELVAIGDVAHPERPGASEDGRLMWKRSLDPSKKHLRYFVDPDTEIEYAVDLELKEQMEEQSLPLALQVEKQLLGERGAAGVIQHLSKEEIKTLLDEAGKEPGSPVYGLTSQDLINQNKWERLHLLNMADLAPVNIFAPSRPVPLPGHSNEDVPTLPEYMLRMQKAGLPGQLPPETQAEREAVWRPRSTDSALGSPRELPRALENTIEMIESGVMDAIDPLPPLGLEWTLTEPNDPAIYHWSRFRTYQEGGFVARINPSAFVHDGIQYEVERVAVFLFETGKIFLSEKVLAKKDVGAISNAVEEPENEMLHASTAMHPNRTYETLLMDHDDLNAPDQQITLSKEFEAFLAKEERGEADLYEEMHEQRNLDLLKHSAPIMRQRVFDIPHNLLLSLKKVRWPASQDLYNREIRGVKTWPAEPDQPISVIPGQHVPETDYKVHLSYLDTYVQDASDKLRKMINNQQGSL